MSDSWRRRGSTSPGPAARAACLCLLAVLTCGRPATEAQAPGVDGRAALQAAVALVQEGQLAEADRQARRALGDPETRAVAYSVLGTIKLRQNALDDSAKLLGEAVRLEPRLVLEVALVQRVVRSSSLVVRHRLGAFPDRQFEQHGGSRIVAILPGSRCIG